MNGASDNSCTSESQADEHAHNRIDRLAQPNGPDLYHEIMEVQDLGCEQVMGMSKVPIDTRKQVK